jgi:excinuclease ABC subunit B
MKFEMKSKYAPAGDQPAAIAGLVEGISDGLEKQTLLGVTGSGKTFTIANVIQQTQMPTLVIAHNKTLAAQLANEFKEFFPNNAVHYFVSYYDYYQPEAYVSATDTYIEKDAQINEEIDRLRHASTQSLLTRTDVIIVASVSCIYGLGSPKEYFENNFFIEKGGNYSKREFLEKLISLHYERTNADLAPGKFRSIGNSIEVMPVQEKITYRFELFGTQIMNIIVIDPITGIIQSEPPEVMLFPTKHFMADQKQIDKALKDIKKELDVQLQKFESEGKLLEAERLKRRTTYDMAMIREVGYCSGIENYSRPLSGKKAGEPPETLLSYFPRNEDGSPAFLTVIDESHVTISQLGAMYAGDRSRKENLVDFGFRLPSALDNRPLRAEEFWQRAGQTIFVSATPGKYEAEHSQKVVEQIIRPTGLIDPEIIVRPVVAGISPHQNSSDPLQIPSQSSASKPAVSRAKNPQSFDAASQATTVNVSKTSELKKLVQIADSNYPGQIQDFINEAELAIRAGGRVLATTLTKRMAEDLSLYLKDRGLRAEYLHSDVETLDRIKILTKLRKGDFDVLVGVNLLREGLDLPEVTLVGILDADKEGFLRSETSLIQTIGRAARNIGGRVILYADHITNSMEKAISETNRRRAIQVAFNTEHNITPISISKEIKDITELLQSDHDKTVATELSTDLAAFGGDLKKLLAHKREQMELAASELDFETAAIVRDEILELERRLLKGTGTAKKAKRA